MKKIKQASNQELAHYLKKALSTVKSYPRDKLILMRIGLRAYRDGIDMVKNKEVQDESNL